ncbi:ABC transporter substrate-binding protein [Streptomyces aculeolatus]|uniref:ABC transporter substrate-binding protein n=1 Tax=Streptomyces aculeolatus TaxID=270689 RepID=UPI001CED5A4E|nr:ABC transporter substrate-binding protein [Streptomyces aculeolatus]
MVAALAAGALALSGCSSGSENDEASQDEKDKAQKQQAQIPFADAKASTGPAAEVKGAQEGGTVSVMQRDSYAHLDPGQIYVSDEGSLSRLIHRGLTGYKADASGKQSLVGDLATDSGKPSDGGRTWTYTLKDNIKWADGTDITSKDVRHTFERQFAEFINDGPVFIQQWLANTPGTEYREMLPKGPYDGDHLPDSVLETPDDKTIVFKFEDPKPDLPYALAMPGYSMVSEAKDTQEKYDKAPMTAGPYKIESFKTGKSMTLVKNEHWDPATDVTRNAYPDKYEITFNIQYETSTERLMADQGANKTAVSFNNQVDAATLPKLNKDPEAQKRTASGYQPYVSQMAINMDRVKNKKVREAIAYALPIQPYQQAYGGPQGHELAGGLISPTVSGFEDGFDPFGKLKKPLGDPAKAKKILEDAGETGYKLTWGYINTPEGQNYSPTMEATLEEAGFDVQRKEISSETYYDEIGLVDNKFDMYVSAWGADWPSASTVVPPLYDGRQIQDGSSNYSHTNDEHINSEIDRIQKITDPAEAAKEWNTLSQYVVKDLISNIPITYYKQIQLHGSKIGGVQYDDVIGAIDLRKLYVKQ